MDSNLYLLLKFLHVTAAIGMFVCWGIEWLSLDLQHERDQCRGTISGNLKNIARLQTISIITLVATGIWMSVSGIGFSAWMAWAIIAIVLMEVLAGFLPRYAVAWKHDRKRFEEDSGSIHILSMKSAMQLRMAIGIGIVALMTLKPQTLLQCACIVSASVLAGGYWALANIRKRSVARSS